MLRKTFSEHELASLAKQFRTKSGKRAVDVARELGVGKTTIHLAEEYPEKSLTKIRKRLIEEYSPFELVGPVFYLKRKTSSPRKERRSLNRRRV